AKDFIGHLKDDNGKDNFVVTSFNGNRGLEASWFEGDSPLAIEKPSISHADLIKMGQDWINAMGGEFKGDAACGCVPKGWVFKGGSFTCDLSYPPNVHIHEELKLRGQSCGNIDVWTIYMTESASVTGLPRVPPIIDRPKAPLTLDCFPRGSEGEREREKIAGIMCSYTEGENGSPPKITMRFFWPQ